MFTQRWKGNQIVGKINRKQKIHLTLEKALFCQNNEPTHNSMPSVTRCSPEYNFKPFRPFDGILDKRKPTWEEGVSNEVNIVGTPDFHGTTGILSLICFVMVVVFFLGWLILKLISYTVRKRQDRERKQLDQKICKML